MIAATFNTINDVKVKEQIISSMINNINDTRILEEAATLKMQETLFSNAMEEMKKVRDFIGSPEKILGSPLTKHGEIAEQVEVGVRRAREALNGENLTATFEGVGRTAPEDYIIDNIAVQSKFINGTNNNLKEVLSHMDKYSSFGRDGSYYHIPKDEYETIQKILNNESIEGLKQKTIDAIKMKVTLIEEESGKSFDEVVKPGISTYAEVQQGRVHETIDNHENSINKNNELKKEEIIQEYKPSITEGTKAAGLAGTVGAAISLTTSLYKKAKDGKKFYKGELSKNDWKEVGVDTLEGGVIGAISGATIYGLTNYTSLSAPFAGAIVSASKGINSLKNDFSKEKINEEEFIELGMILCSESAIVGFATYSGQALIPIPILGAIIGSIAGTILTNYLGSRDEKTASTIRNEIDTCMKQLDEEYKKLILEVLSEFDKLDKLTKVAFDVNNNSRLVQSSINLARAYNVKESKIIKSTSELDSFMLG